MNNITTVTIDNLDSTQDEEQSYYFLQFYQFAKDWFIYDSFQLGLHTAEYFTNKFSTFHGKILFPQQELSNQNLSSFWSSVPLGIFKFKYLEDQSYSLIHHYKQIPGYIVQGAYWENGFFYTVKDSDSIIQIKLFIDEETKELYHYPDSSLV